jgi:thiol-disulfide isomerase/thioredoxin
MMGEREKDQIREWGQDREGERILRFAGAENPLDERFKEYAHLMAELAPCIKAKKDGDAMVPLPTLFVGSRVAYQALPLERELEPFLSVLEDADAFADRIAPDLRQRLDQLSLPALVKVYVTSHCPHCPATVSLLLGMAACSEQVRVTVIDGELFPDAAVKDKVSAAPTVILDDRFRWTGSVDAGELVTLMLDRDPAGLGPDALRSMIEEGDAEGVAKMMALRGKLFDGFIQLLAHPRWSVRLGAMVAFETLVENDPELAKTIVDPLIRVFDKVDAMAQGDLLHILGESGNPAALPFLKSVMDGNTDEEVRSAAQEAVEKLE